MPKSPRIGASWRPGEGRYRLHASAGRAWKLPSFFALSGTIASIQPVGLPEVDAKRPEEAAELVKAAEYLASRPEIGRRGIGAIALYAIVGLVLMLLGFYASAAQAQEAEARLTTLYEQSRPQVPEPIRPALETFLLENKSSGAAIVERIARGQV